MHTPTIQQKNFDMVLEAIRRKAERHIDSTLMPDSLRDDAAKDAHFRHFVGREIIDRYIRKGDHEAAETLVELEGGKPAPVLSPEDALKAETQQKAIDALTGLSYRARDFYLDMIRKNAHPAVLDSSYVALRDCHEHACRLMPDDQGRTLLTAIYILPSNRELRARAEKPLQHGEAERLANNLISQASDRQAGGHIR